MVELSLLCPVSIELVGVDELDGITTVDDLDAGSPPPFSLLEPLVRTDDDDLVSLGTSVADILAEWLEPTRIVSTLLIEDEIATSEEARVVEYQVETSADTFRPMDDSGDGVSEPASLAVDEEVAKDWVSSDERVITVPALEDLLSEELRIRSDSENDEDSECS